MTTEIRPRIIDGSPMCSGKECPAFHDYVCWNEAPTIYRYTKPDFPCIPGLRRLLAERTEERDAARRELCEYMQRLWVGTKEEHATSRGWSYLYPDEKTEDKSAVSDVSAEEK